MSTHLDDASKEGYDTHERRCRRRRPRTDKTFVLNVCTSHPTRWIGKPSFLSFAPQPRTIVAKTSWVHQCRVRLRRRCPSSFHLHPDEDAAFGPLGPDRGPKCQVGPRSDLRLRICLPRQRHQEGVASRLQLTGSRPPVPGTILATLQCGVGVFLGFGALRSRLAQAAWDRRGDCILIFRKLV